MKKKLIVLFLLCSAIALFAYSYPATLAQLLDQYRASRTKVFVTTNEGGTLRSYSGYIELVQDDYFLFREVDLFGGLSAFNLHNVVRVGLE